VSAPRPAADLPPTLVSALSLGDAVAEIAERFEPDSVLCIVLFDVASLAEIETQHGSDAYAGVIELFEKRFFGLAATVLEPGDVLARGEIGRSEYALLMLRSYGSALSERELPALALRLVRGVERQGQRIVYPYRRRFPQLPAGCAVALRNPRLRALTQVRNALEEARRDADLNRAIQRRERRRRFLSVLLEQRVQSVYEPIVCTRTLTVYGYEALARGPEGTEYGPASSLFDAAEDHDMLYELDALCRAAALDGASGFPPGTKLFMNIRPSAIHDPRFHPSALIRTLERSHLKPSDVVFEISEQESIENYSVFREARDKYGQLGFQFALDDTGAGYASLEAAMELAPEFIKVDRSFMKGIDEDQGRQAMVRGFQQVARSVGARIIGEGLDRLEELQKLAELGIEFGQGWLFGRATPMRAKSG